MHSQPLQYLRQCLASRQVRDGGQKGSACRQVVKGRAVSTFLTETDLAGLKVCSGSSSPSIVSVQSDSGASCNSKLNQQSPPGPALKYQRAHRMELAEGMQQGRLAQCTRR